MSGPVLIAVDLSEANRPAFEAGIRLAKDLGAPVVLLHVVRPVPETIRRHPGTESFAENAEKELTQEAAQALTAEWAEEARKEGLDVEPVIRKGDARDLIEQEVQARDARLLVLGSHGRSGVRRLLLGSVAESLVRRLDRPLLVVPSPRDD